MLKKRLPIVIFILAIFAFLLFKLTYVSLGISILTLILSFIFPKIYIRMFFLTIFISVITIVTDCVILYKDNFVEDDIFNDTNVLLGTWHYNNDTGKYVFNDDYTYIKYYNLDNLDNYCLGTYEYNYGGTDIDGNVIMQDENYYYFDLVFYVDSCINDWNEEYINNSETLIFGINKDDSNDLIFIEPDNNYVYKAIKKYKH